MSSQHERSYRTRTRVSEISINLPFFGKVFLIGGHSPEKQIKQARSLLAKRPQDVNRRLGLALLLAEAGQNEEALSEWMTANQELPFDDGVRDDPVLSQKNAWSHYVFGMILHNKGAVESAILEWDKASSLDQYGIGQLAKDQKKAAQNPGPSD